jgi:hypothetical protein
VRATRAGGKSFVKPREGDGSTSRTKRAREAPVGGRRPTALSPPRAAGALCSPFGCLAARISRGEWIVGNLSRLDLWQPHERRLVLLLELDEIDGAVVLVACGDDLLAHENLLGLARFAEVVAVWPMQAIPEHLSSSPGRASMAERTKVLPRSKFHIAPRASVSRGERHQRAAVREALLSSAARCVCKTSRRQVPPPARDGGAAPDASGRSSRSPGWRDSARGSGTRSRCCEGCCVACGPVSCRLPSERGL